LLIGGAISSIFNPVLKLPIAFNVVDLFLLTIIIILGTLLSYSLYINSLIYIEAHTASMLGILEPLVTILLSVALFRTSFLIFQMIGISMILLSLFMINIPSKV
jgi:EamA-like transporter family.